MQNIRLIARMDIKGPNLIKGIHLEGLRVIGSPNVYAKKYYEQGIDEIFFMDVVASLYGRNQLLGVIQEAAQDIFIPITVGGGIGTVEEARQVLRSGADKLALNSAAIKNPEIIRELADEFGSQCVVSSIEAKKSGDYDWEVFFENGRERTGLSVREWARTCEDMGAGEILLTSVDREGTRKGFDVDLVKVVSDEVSVPVIASGGMGETKHLVEVVEIGRASAVAIADALHYGRISVSDIRESITDAGISVRTSL